MARPGVGKEVPGRQDESHASRCGEDPPVVAPEPDRPGRVDLRESDDLGTGRGGDRLGRIGRIDLHEGGLDRLPLAGVARKGTLEGALPGDVPVGLHEADQAASRVYGYEPDEIV